MDIDQSDVFVDVSGDSRDWQSRKTLVDCNRYMMKHEIACDVTFNVGKTEVQVQAHKYILICRSSVFHVMFCGPMAEKNKIVDVPDIDPDIFSVLLRYMYCDEVEIEEETVMQIMYAAKKYSVQGIVDHCTEYLQRNINVDNVCCILEQAHIFDERSLYQTCLDFIYENAEDVLMSASFGTLCVACTDDVISSDRLFTDEKTVFESMLSWADEVCLQKEMEVGDANRREALGELLYRIRFPLMNLSYYADVVSKCNVLSQDEKLDIYQYLCRSEPSSTVSKFSTKYRAKKSFQTCNRFKYTSENSDWAQRGKKDAVSFTCCHPVWLQGVVLYGSKDTCTPYDVTIRLLGADDMQLSQLRSTVTTKHTEQTVSVYFENPVKIFPKVHYTIEVVMVGPKSYYGENGRRKVPCNNVTFEFMSSSKSNNSTNVFTGQIPGLIYSLWL